MSTSNASEQRSGKKATFTIRLTYFKATGKFYTTTEFKWKGASVGAPESPPSCYMNDVASHIRGLRDNGGQGSLPGLSLFSAGWDGFILIDCEEGYPVLLIPRKED